MSPRILSAINRLRDVRPGAGQETYNREILDHVAAPEPATLAPTTRSKGEIRGQLLHVNKLLISELLTHALESDPDECCGFMFGKDGVATEVRRMDNVHDDKLTRFFMDYREVEKVQRDADALGQDLLAIYHSHTYTHAYPSETDIETAVETGWVPYHYIVISLVEKTRPVVRAFWIAEDAQVSEVFLETG